LNTYLLLPDFFYTHTFHLFAFCHPVYWTLTLPTGTRSRRDYATDVTRTGLVVSLSSLHFYLPTRGFHTTLLVAIRSVLLKEDITRVPLPQVSLLPCLPHGATAAHLPPFTGRVCRATPTRSPVYWFTLRLPHERAAERLTHNGVCALAPTLLVGPVPVPVVVGFPMHGPSLPVPARLLFPAQFPSR